MYIFLVILIIVVCVILAAVVLIQNSKGGGLAANFSAPTQVMGVRQTTDFLEKATWVLAGALMVLSIIATIAIPHSTSVDPMHSEVTASNDLTPMQQPASTATPLDE
ncbi:MAG: preprotein translocase subunit SecG [Bacteroidales bacterium]|nr:preprotein translocase subunit SecG [Bacteroidales bacterium]